MTKASSFSVIEIFTLILKTVIGEGGGSQLVRCLYKPQSSGVMTTLADYWLEQGYMGYLNIAILYCLSFAKPIKILYNLKRFSDKN